MSRLYYLRMKRRPLKAGLAISAMVVIAACGSSSKSTAGSGSSTTRSTGTASSKAKGSGGGEPKLTAQEIATKLAPLGCVPTPSQPNTANLGQPAPVAALDCAVSGENVTISEYKSKKDLISNVQAARGPGCIAAKLNDVTDALLVSGRQWAVHWPKTTSTAQAIENAIGDGAKIVSIHC